jgi:hypothetical protein
MNEILMLAKASVSAAICFRLFCFEWDGSSRYRIGVTAAAYFLMVCSGAVAIFLAMGNQSAAQIFDMGIYAAVMIMMIRSRGNLAKILELRDGQKKTYGSTGR